MSSQRPVAEEQPQQQACTGVGVTSEGCTAPTSITSGAAVAGTANVSCQRSRSAKDAHLKDAACPGAGDAAGGEGVSNVSSYLEDLSICVQNAVSMLPPSPVNTLEDFLAGVVSGKIKPAWCHMEPRVDGHRYWEKRRVQTLLRRVVEALQDVMGMEPGDMMKPDDCGAIYDLLVKTAVESKKKREPQVTADPSFVNTADAFESGLDKETFLDSLQQLRSWPPEMSLADREEVFVALSAQSGMHVCGMSVTGTPLPLRLSRRMVCQGLQQVPFNLPDFPVPTGLLRPGLREGCSSSAPLSNAQRVENVAQEISRMFGNESIVLQTKDFYVCGLVSLEEIQVALPELVPKSVVEESVLKIIRTGAKLFHPREWESLVISVRTLVSDEPRQEERLPEQEANSLPQAPTLSSPATRHRDVLEPDESAQPRDASIVEDPSSCRADSASDGPSPIASGTVPGAYIQSMEAPAATRELPCEEPVEFSFGPSSVAPTGPCWSGSAGARDGAAASFPPESTYVVNWSTTQQPDSAEGFGGAVDPAYGAIEEEGQYPGHQADEGAGTPQPQAHRQLTRHDTEEDYEVVATFHSPFGGHGNRSPFSVSDPVPWISMEMHNECRGPFLAKAFVRCCALYEATRGTNDRMRYHH